MFTNELLDTDRNLHQHDFEFKSSPLFNYALQVCVTDSVATQHFQVQ